MCQPFIKHTFVSQYFRADLCSRGARGFHHVVDHGQRPVGDPGEHADEDHRHLDFGRFPHHLIGCHHPDKHQDGYDGAHRNNGEHESPQAEQRHEEHCQTGSQGIADAGTHRFPARVPYIYGHRERVPQQATQRGCKSVGQHDFAGVILVACGVGALDVLKVEDVVGQTQGYSRSQIRQRVREPLQETIDMHLWRVEAKG
ncbi:hypothetical protein D3C86_1519510 [compost metagenome]